MGHRVRKMYSHTWARSEDSWLTTPMLLSTIKVIWLPLLHFGTCPKFWSSPCCPRDFFLNPFMQTDVVWNHTGHQMSKGEKIYISDPGPSGYHSDALPTELSSCHCYSLNAEDTDSPLYTDTQYNNKIHYNDRLTHKTFT